MTNVDKNIDIVVIYEVFIEQIIVIDYQIDII